VLRRRRLPIAVLLSGVGVICPHSLHGRADRCSQCAGAVPRRISQDGSALLVDGLPADRSVSIDQPARLTRYQRRGGLSTQRSRRMAITARPRR
jgi:hypothetical protein